MRTIHWSSSWIIYISDFYCLNGDILMKIFKAVRDRSTTTLELNAFQLRNLFNFMKEQNIYMPWYPVKAKTGVDGRLRFEVVVPNTLIQQIAPQAALDAIVEGLVG